MDDFLPEGYEVPAAQSPYLNKFPKGQTRIRPMGSVTLGYEAWKTEKGDDGKDKNKVYRFDMKSKPKNVKEFKDGKCTHFWAFPVYNYDLKQVQIAIISQKSIQEEIHGLVMDPSWGSPVGPDGYDLVITRKGETKNDTEYSLRPAPKEKLSEDIMNLYVENMPDMRKFMQGENPFGNDEADQDSGYDDPGFVSQGDGEATVNID